MNLVIFELEEMLNKAQLYSQQAVLPSQINAYTDLKSTLRILIAMERGIEDERKTTQNA